MDYGEEKKKTGDLVFIKKIPVYRILTKHTISPTRMEKGKMCGVCQCAEKRKLVSELFKRPSYSSVQASFGLVEEIRIVAWSKHDFGDGCLEAEPSVFLGGCWQLIKDVAYTRAS